MIGQLCVLSLGAFVLSPRGVAAIDRARAEEALRRAANWDYGDKADDRKYLRGVAVEAAKNPADALGFEKLLVDALGGAGTNAGKAFFCRQLVLVGTERCVPALAKLLTDKDLSHMALYALERIPGEEANRALRRALPAVDDRLRIGLISSLGRRGDTRAVDYIIRQIAGRNTEVAGAALDALRRIDSDKAVRAIARARRRLSGRLKSVADDAYLDVAARLAGQGRAARAAAIYEELYKPSESSMCRVGALQGLVACRPDKAMALAIAALEDEDLEVRCSAVPALRAVPGAEATRAIAAELTKHPPGIQIMLVKVLADRGDTAALSDVAELTGNPDVDVRCAAIEALGALGDPSVVTMLAAIAARATGDEQKTARNSLDGLRAEGVSAAIVGQLSSTDPRIRLECVRSLGVRRATDSVDAILAVAEDKDTEVARAAVKSLRALAGPEHVPALVALLVKTSGKGARREAEQAVVSAARKIPADDRPARAVLAALRRRPARPAKASLVTVLGKIADKAALGALYAAVRDADPDVQIAAVRGLAAWPTADPAETMRRLARDRLLAENLRIIALRGYIAQIGLSGDATDEEALRMYADAMRIARRPDEKKRVLSEVSEMRHEGALAMAKRSLADPALKDAAAEAVRKIDKALKAPALAKASHNSHKAKNALDGDPKTRWDTGAAMAGGEWFLLDLGRSKTITRIVLDTKGSRGDYPRGYEVYVSRNSRGKGKMVAKGEGKVVTEIRLEPPAFGRFVRIVQTGRTSGLYWSIHELTVDTE